jgi:ubiquitin C-terminal hydrolase
MQYPDGYYQYELVGIVVHMGTAEAGHYYSYIKEQEKFRLQEDNTEKWYEFNDAIVREFDPSEIPAETFGGEDQG